ncbi:MAG: helix-turn-helix domain-containing protein [Burkholderiales bacterium]|jgi:hypothetical protein|nr:helix-turn-helix domain-containing protein [Burkholderiales bacterium]
MSKTQQTMVLDHLRKRSITQAEAAAKYGIFGLAKVISDLGKVGYTFEKRWAFVKVGGVTRRMMRYTLKAQ